MTGLSGRRLPQDVSLELAARRNPGHRRPGRRGPHRIVAAPYSALDPVRSGEVRVGADSASRQAAARIRAGLGLVSEDRKGEGLAQSRSIADNLTYSRLSPYSRWGWLNLRRRRRRRATLDESDCSQSRRRAAVAATLSGGNQQKVAIARVLHQDADVLLLDEPTRGIDVGTKAEIYRLIGQLAAEGKAIIFVSSYLPELLAVCDRIGRDGAWRLREIRPVTQWTEESMMACAIGGDGCADQPRRKSWPSLCRLQAAHGRCSEECSDRFLA